MSIVLTDLISEFGAYYRPGSQNEQDLYKQFFAKNGTSVVFGRRVTEGTIMEGGLVTQSAVLQGYQDTYTPYGDTSLAGLTHPLYKLKVDLDMKPDVIEQSWIGFLADNSLDRKNYPIVRYIMENLIIPQMEDDYERTAVYKGVYSAPTDGVPHPVANSIDGLKKKINDGIDNSSIDPIVVGAVPTDDVDFVDYVEEFLDAIPEEVLPRLSTLNMSITLMKRFRRGMRAKYNMSYSQASDLLVPMDYDNILVNGHLSHAGSTKIWTTPFGNVSEGVKKPTNEEAFQIESARRVVSIFTDFYKGLGIWQGRYFYTNDVELPS